MSKSYKLSGTGNYIDASGVIYNKKELPNYLHDVINNLTSTSAINALSANQGKILHDKLKGTVLYNNSSGTIGTVTLSQSAGNFTYLEMFFSHGDYNNYIKINNPNKKSFIAETNYWTGSESSFGGYRTMTAKYTVSDTNITTSYRGFVDSDGYTSEHDKSIYVYKVVGYRLEDN